MNKITDDIKYIISYDIKTDTFAIEDIIPRQTCTEVGKPLPDTHRKRPENPETYLHSKANTAEPDHHQSPFSSDFRSRFEG